MFHDAEFSMTRVFQRALVTWLRNLISFTVLSAIIHAPLVLLLLTGAEESLGFLHSHGLIFAMLAGACTTLVHAAIAHSLAEQLLGLQPRIIGSLVTILERAIPLVGLGMFVGLLAHFMEVTSYGAIASLFVYTFYIVTIPVLVIERLDVSQALITSQNLTQGHRLPILGVCVLMGLVSVGLGVLVLNSDMAEVHGRLLPLFGFLVFTPLQAVATMAIYQELRVDEAIVANHRAFPKARTRRPGKSRAR